MMQTTELGNLDDENPLVIEGNQQELRRCREFRTVDEATPWSDTGDAIRISARRGGRWREAGCAVLDNVDIFAPAAGSDTSRLIDVLALREKGWPTAAADAPASVFGRRTQRWTHDGRGMGLGEVPHRTIGSRGNEPFHLPGIEDVVRHALEHLKHTVVLKIEHQKNDWQLRTLRQLRCWRGDNLELRSNPKYLETMRLAFGPGHCKSAVTRTQYCHRKVNVTMKRHETVNETIPNDEILPTSREDGCQALGDPLLQHSRSICTRQV